MRMYFLIVLGGFWLTSGTLLITPAYGAAEDARLQVMQQELNTLQTEIRQVREQQGTDWLTERRAEEVKGLIHEVLSDADTRAALLADELTCYYENGFILRDADTFLLKIGGYMQFRYLNNNATATDNDEEAGFQTRRASLIFSGYVGSPRVSYLFMPSVSRGSGNVFLEYFFMKYQIDDHWDIMGGQFKAPFGREWLNSARLLPTIERSYVHSLFTSLYVQGVQATRQDEQTRLKLAFHNGTWGWNTDFDEDNTDYALGVRGEWKVAGDWKQFSDTLGWSQDKSGLLLGAAVQYDKGERGGVTALPDILKYTVDAGLEGSGWNLLAAFTARHIESTGSTGIIEADQWGAFLQAGIFIIPDKMDLYARYEWIDVDGVAFSQSAGTTTATDNDVVRLLTVGTNYFFRGHSSKLSFDVVYAFDGLPKTDTGAGLRASDGSSTTLRSQFQLSF